MRRLERPLLCIAIAVVGVLIVRELLWTPPATPAREARPQAEPGVERRGVERILMG